MEENVLELLQEAGRRHRIVGAILSVVLVAFLGLSDYLTGSELSFSIFYLIPISFTTIFLGRAGGFIISFISAATWFVADLMSGAVYSHFLIPYWNAVVRLGYFSLHTFLLAILFTVIGNQRRKSRIDSLTGAANWRWFEERSREEIARERRKNEPLTLVYFDLDNFKQINDMLGHDVGDHLLRTVTEIIQGQLRPSDMLSRVGGDEFAILLPEADYNGAEGVLRRVREGVASEMGKRGWPVTLSMGAVTFTLLPSSIGPMLKRADELMYEVKRSGKNNWKHIQWPPPGGELNL